MLKIFSKYKSCTSLRSTQLGFTLVEMIVALGLFSIVATVALGALVKIISANKKAQSLQSSITNLNFALDSMSRELRVGKNYKCDKNPTSYGYNGDLDSSNCGASAASSSGGDQVALAFVSSKTASNGPSGTCNLAYAYRFIGSNSNWSLEKATQPDCANGISASDFSNIIDDNVTITGYYVDVIDNSYPRVVLRISGYAGIREREKTYFDVQTTISSRFEKD